MANPWDNDPIIAPAGGSVPPPMPMGGPSVRPLVAPRPKPVEPRRPNTTTVEGTVLNIGDDGSVTPIYTAPPKPGEKVPVDPVLSGVIKGLGIRELLIGVERSRRNLAGGWATGVKGQFGGLVMGSERNDFLGNLDSLKGAITMEKLAALKEASATGASGMGALSEKEGERLASAVAALSDRMSQGELETSMGIIEHHAKMLQAIADGKNPELPEVQAEYKIPPLPSIGGPAPEGVVTNPNYGKHGTIDPDNGALNVDIFEEPKLLPADQARIDARLAKGGNTGDFVAGAVDAVTFGAGDEIAAGGDALIGSLSGKGAFADLYKSNVAVERGANAGAAERSPWIYGGGQVLGGAAVPLGVGARGVNALARVGAAQGAAYGFGSAEGNALERVGPTIIGAGIGGAAGGALGVVAPRVGAALEPLLRPRGRAPDAIRLLRDENITPRGSLLPGNADRAAALEAKGGSGPIIRAADAQTIGELEGRVGQLSGGGTSLNETMLAGEKLQSAGARYISKSGQMANRIYARARGLAGNERIIPTNAIKTVDDRLAVLNENPDTNAGEIAFFEGIRKDLFQRRGKTVDGARQLRQSIRGRINQDNLTATQAEAEAMKVMDALRQDARDSLPSGAGQAFEVADRFYAERMAEIETVANKFIGPRTQPMSGEKAFAKFRSMATNTGDGRRLAAVWRNLEPEEQRDLAATFVERLGRSGDSPTAPFSAALFVSQVEKGLSPAARRTMFGPAGARSVDNLVELSRQLTAVQRRQNNSSTTRTASNDIARAVVPGGSMGALVGGTTTNIGAGLTAAGLTVGAMFAARMVRNLSARALMSPRLTRWLADAPSVQSAAQTRAHVARLGNIMTREPAIAAEIAPIHRMLTQDLTPRAVASEPEGQRDDR